MDSFNEVQPELDENISYVGNIVAFIRFVHSEILLLFRVILFVRNSVPRKTLVN